MKSIKNNIDSNLIPANEEIILYNPGDNVNIQVRLVGDTVWLNRQQMSELFDRDVKTIGKHINAAMKEELRHIPTVAKFATVQNEGSRLVSRIIEFYNLDMIISVGFRVKSERGIHFRQWANRILKEYLLKGYSINNRVSRLEERVSKTEGQIDFFIKSSLPPVQGVFFNGQIFDAYRFVSDLIRRAKCSIALIDNYVDDSVLSLLDKRGSDVSATVYTRQISSQLRLDLDRHNSQYPEIRVRPFNKAHDRFLLIDNEVYHIGASIKDLGKKWFGFTLMKDISSRDILERIASE